MERVDAIVQPLVDELSEADYWGRFDFKNVANWVAYSLCQQTTMTASKPDDELRQLVKLKTLSELSLRGQRAVLSVTPQQKERRA
jgi:hypothetical protein